MNTSDATNTGYTDKKILSEMFVRAYQEGHWYAGVMLWQFSSDTGGQAVSAIISKLKSLYDIKH